MKKVLSLLLMFLIFPLIQAAPVRAECDTSKTTICTIEIWLGHIHKKHKKEIRQTLKDRSLKVLRHTVQYWRPTGGHPPTNIAIGRGLSVEDAQWAIEFALKYNDRIDGLVHQAINPPNYVAIATSAWDDKSETPITPENLGALRDTRLTTEQFHLLYRKLTDEGKIRRKFY